MSADQFYLKAVLTKTSLLITSAKEKIMFGTILIVIVILLLLGALPTWPHSRNWGYGPSGGLGLVLVILLVLVLMGYIPRGF